MAFNSEDVERKVGILYFLKSRKFPIEMNFGHLFCILPCHRDRIPNTVERGFVLHYSKPITDWLIQT